MSNNDDRIQPKRSKDDILNDTQVISMMDFGKDIKMVMDNFKICEKIEIKHSDIITEHIKEVKKLQEIFCKFVNESLDLNDQLEEYSRNIFFFTECFIDINNYSDEEILELLESHLKDSQKNYKLAKKLKNILVNENVGIINKLSKIKNSTFDFIDDFESDEREIILYEGGTFYRYCIIVLLNLAYLAMPLDVFTKKKPCKEFVAKSEKWLDKNNKIEELNNKRNEIEMVKLFGENLRSIIRGISRIETFWDRQIRSIERLIGNLKRLDSSSEKRITQRQIVYNIGQKWKNVEKECELYYIEMKKLLHENRYVEKDHKILGD
ncbi:hypothetical protein C1646_752195 [Rhizophagus diaphanus]|nr:hypothetical protein C1646_752195 [Rhizophagus diaphanus] [Rhizophagus sp. MUCL 43196]